MTRLRDTLLRIIDDGAKQAKGILGDFDEVVKSIDFDNHLEYIKERKDELIQKSQELFNEFTDFMKQVKDSLTDFSVTVPFDESIGEQISYDVTEDGRKLCINVTFNGDNQTRKNTTEVIIPELCDLERLTYRVNPKLKVATITIPKKPFGQRNQVMTEQPADTQEEVEDTVVPEAPMEEEQPQEQPSVQSRRRGRPKKKRPVAQPETVQEESTVQEPEETAQNEVPDVSEEVTTISEKLASRLNANVAKSNRHNYRNSAGRFTRREPNK